MSDHYLGEIRMFGGNYAPSYWSMCNGQLLPIDQYPALYNLIGNIYGGDGVENFALPDLRGRVPMHAGNGFALGQRAGSETVTLTRDTLAAHNHLVTSIGAPGNSSDPANAIMADQGPAGLNIFGYVPYDGANQVIINPDTIGFAGSTQPHENMQPYLTITFIIALDGEYPTRN